MGKLSTFLLAIFLAPGCLAADIAGYVLSVQGKWSLQGRLAPLAVGAPVPQGASLVVASPAAGDHIVVVESRSGAVLVSRQCDTARACARPLPVPRPREDRAQGASLARLFNGILARIAGDPDRYITTLSRGSARLGDAVLPWSERGVDLAPVLPALPPESDHTIALTTLKCQGPGACPQQPLISPIGGQRSTTIHGPAPGLYELVIHRSRGSIGPDRVRAWILLLPAPQLARAEELYRAAAVLTESWGTDVDAATKQGFLRALLEELAGA